MKQRILLLCLSIIATVSNAGAQSYYLENDGIFFGGLVAGANFSQIDGDNYKGYDNVGLNVGGIVYSRVNTEIAASLEILYTQRGAYGKDVRDLGVKGIFTSNYRATITYAEVPIMLHYFFPSKNHLGAGFSYARVVQSKESVTTYPDQKYDDTQYPFRKNAVDFVLDGKIRVWKGLFVNPRFQYGITPVRGEGELPKFLGRKQFSNVWTLRVVYLFGLKYNKSK